MNLEKALSLSYSREGGRLAELIWLAERASEHKYIVEIGSWVGCSTRALADNTPGTVTAVDHFKGSSTDNTCNPDEQFNTFNRNTADLTNLLLMRMSSLEAAKVFTSKNMFVDMIFIDAEHTYESVKADILTWRPLLSESGLLCGHDFEPRFPGVMQAVQELLPNAKATGAGTIWAV